MCFSFIVVVSEHLIVHCSYACLYFLPVFYSFRRDRPSLWCIRLPIILPASMAVTLKPCHCWLVHQMAALLAGSSDGCIVGWFIKWLQFLCSSPYVSGVPDILSLRENCDLDANAFKTVPGPLYKITKLP